MQPASTSCLCQDTLLACQHACLCTLHCFVCVAQDLHLGGGRATGLQLGTIAVPFRCIMPIGAGFVVAWLHSLGFSPALKFLTRAIEGVVDDSKTAALPTSYWQVWHAATQSRVVAFHVYIMSVHKNIHVRK